jgi:cell division protease FtsH
VGPIAFGEREEHIFLGRGIHQHTDYSEKTAQEIDKEVKIIIDEMYGRAKTILEDKIEVLHAMASALLERETLDAEGIKVLLEGGTLEPLAATAADSESVKEVEKKTEESKPSTRPEEFPRGIPPLADPDAST